MSARRDASLMYSNAQALPASAASTNTLDLSDALHQIGQGARKIKVVVSVDTTFAGSLTSADFAFQDSADNTTFADTGIKLSAVAVAKLTAGTLVMAFDLPSTGGAGQVGGQLGDPPPGPSPLRRYTRMNYTLTGGGSSAGAVNADVEIF